MSAALVRERPGPELATRPGLSRAPTLELASQTRDVGRLGVRQVAAMQGLAGNRAVAAALSRSSGLQRSCACGGTGADCKCGGHGHEETVEQAPQQPEGVQRTCACGGTGDDCKCGGHDHEAKDEGVQRQDADDDRAGGEGGGDACSTRCGGIPADCPPPFCCPFPTGTATLIRNQIEAPFLLAIASKVTASVVPVWAMWFNGGTSLQNFTSRFGTDFATDPTTVRVSSALASRLAGQVDAAEIQRLAATATPGVPVSILSALPGDFRTRTTTSLEAPGPTQMDFSTIGTAPGNLAGGIGKTQTTCAVGATPSPVDDARELVDVQAMLTRNPDGSVTVTPTFSYRVTDTVDLCPGNCGSGLGVINEQQATFPMSRLEASGVSGDVPFTVDFSSPTQPAFTVAPPAPPVPHDITVSSTTLFDFGSDQLRPEAEAALLAQLGDRPAHADLTQPFVVEGHTDGRGSDAVNQPLSEARARRVAALLERRFPNLAGHVTPVGFGSTRPVAPNTLNGADNPDGRRQNRRVELHFSAPPASGP